jgi:hypothetical protein
VIQVTPAVIGEASDLASEDPQPAAPPGTLASPDVGKDVRVAEGTRWAPIARFCPVAVVHRRPGETPSREEVQQKLVDRTGSLQLHPVAGAVMRS